MKYLTIATFLILTSSISLAKNPSAKKVFETNKAVIWGFTFISNDELLYTIRNGKIFYLNIKTKENKELNSPKVISKGQGGLLDIVLKNIDGNRFVYVTFSDKDGGTYTTSLARAKYKNKSVSKFDTIFKAKVKSDTTRHFGSRLVFQDNFLFMTIGERGERDLAQKLNLHNGKIIRLNPDGSTPKENPFNSNKEVLPQIWSYGHRNPQGIDIDPVTNEVYSCEFGPRGGDELNLIKPKSNYGWPIVTHGKEYWGPSIGVKSKEGMIDPIVYWVPSISPSGMTFYTGDKIKKWKNNLFLANLNGLHLRRLVLKDGKVIQQEKLFEKLNERIRQVRTGKDGYLYFSTDSGKIYKVQ